MNAFAQFPWPLQQRSFPNNNRIIKINQYSTTLALICRNENFAPDVVLETLSQSCLKGDLQWLCGVCNQNSLNLRNGKPKDCSQLSYWFWGRAVWWIMTKPDKTGSDLWSRKLCQRQCWIMHAVKCHPCVSNLCKSWGWRIPEPLIFLYRMKKKCYKAWISTSQLIITKGLKLTGFGLNFFFFFNWQYETTEPGKQHCPIPHFNILYENIFRDMRKQAQNCFYQHYLFLPTYNTFFALLLQAGVQNHWRLFQFGLNIQTNRIFFFKKGGWGGR